MNPYAYVGKARIGFRRLFVFVLALCLMLVAAFTRPS